MRKKEQATVLRYSLKTNSHPTHRQPHNSSPKMARYTNDWQAQGRKFQNLFRLVSHLLTSARLYSHLLAYKNLFFTRNGQKEPPCHALGSVLLGFARFCSVFAEGQFSNVLTPPCVAYCRLMSLVHSRHQTMFCSKSFPAPSPSRNASPCATGQSALHISRF
jgi:hypothetical protein